MNQVIINRKIVSAISLQVLTVLFVCLLSVGVANAHGESVELPHGISVSIDFSKTKFSVDDAVMVTLTYENTSGQAISFLKRGTALEGRIDADFLSIYYQGDKLPYVGRVYKRAPATSADYIRLAPGQKISATVDVLTGYRLDYSGDYSVSPATPGQQALKLGSTTIKLLSDRPIVFTVKKQTPIIDSCAGNRPALIDSALSAAESIARRARDDLSRTPVDRRAEAQRYREWFGTYSQSRWNTVQNNFNRIFSAVSSRRLTFICDDSTGAFAYVYPSRPYEIYLGRAFWNAPRTGTDSKAGTIIHELSHFNVVANTDDVVYGQPGARSLARSNPSNAVRNADSHEYFAENTPGLSMPSPNSPPPPSPTAPDLAVMSISLSDATPFVRETISVSANVENLGDAEATATQVYVKLSTDALISDADPNLAQAPISSLDADAAQAMVSEMQAPIEPRQYWVGVCIASVSGETNTGNNCSGGLSLVVERRMVMEPILMLLMDDV